MFYETCSFIQQFAIYETFKSKRFFIEKIMPFAISQNYTNVIDYLKTFGIPLTRKNHNDAPSEYDFFNPNIIQKNH